MLLLLLCRSSASCPQVIEHRCSISLPPALSLCPPPLHTPFSNTHLKARPVLQPLSARCTADNSHQTANKSFIWLTSKVWAWFEFKKEKFCFLFFYLLQNEAVLGWLWWNMRLTGFWSCFAWLCVKSQTVNRCFTFKSSEFRPPVWDTVTAAGF